MANKITTAVDITGNAAKELEAIAKAAKKANDEIEDSRTAGKRMADAIRANADEAEDELDDVLRMAEKLSNALGPEMAAKIGQNKIEDSASKMRAYGLTIDDVEAEADELASALKRAQDVADRINTTGVQVRSIGDDFDHVSNRADNTRSVVANFAGNAAQELPGVANAMGPMNMAIGQFAEYATEGNIAVSKFVPAIAGLAVAGAAVKGVSDHFQKMAKVKAFDRKQVESFTEALRETDDAAEAVRRTLEEAGKVEFSMNLLGVKDITPIMAEAGVSVETFSKLVAGSDEQLRQWAEEMESAGADADQLKVVTLAVTDQQKNLNAAQEAAAVTTKVFGSATEDLTEAQREATEAAEERRRAEEDLYNQTLASIDKEYAYAQSQRDTADAVERLTETLSDHEATQRDVENAIEDARLAAVDEAAAFAESKGAALDSKAGIDLMVQSLGAQAAALTPGSALRTAIDGYIARLNAIPTQVNTKISAEFWAALGGKKVGSGVPDILKPKAAGATGAIVTQPTQTWVGEAGPEAVIPLNQMPGASPLPQNLGGATVAMTFNMSGYRGNANQFIADLKQWVNTNGPGEITRLLGI